MYLALKKLNIKTLKIIKVLINNDIKNLLFHFYKN